MLIIIKFGDRYQAIYEIILPLHVAGSFRYSFFFLKQAMGKERVASQKGFSKALRLINCNIPVIIPKASKCADFSVIGKRPRPGVIAGGGACGQCAPGPGYNLQHQHKSRQRGNEEGKTSREIFLQLQ